MEKVMLFLLLLHVKGQPPLFPPPKPDKCNRPAEFMYLQCCVFPPFFTREVAKSCGAIIAFLSTDKENNITALRRQPMSLCDHWECVLEKYSLLNTDKTLDDEKYYEHLDRWTDLNQEFSRVMAKAKVHCKNTYRMFLPLTVCEFYDLHGCIRNYVNMDCPILFPNKQCQEKKHFYDECRQFYL